VSGDVPVNQDVISQGAQRAAVLYWYQTPRHVIASEWAAKFWTIADAIRDKRTDTSMVRVVVFNNGRSDDQTIRSARDLARAAYPALKGVLPPAE
jgi:EpsI family protein